MKTWRWECPDCYAGGKGSKESCHEAGEEHKRIKEENKETTILRKHKPVVWKEK